VVQYDLEHSLHIFALSPEEFQQQSNIAADLRTLSYGEGVGAAASEGHVQVRELCSEVSTRVFGNELLDVHEFIHTLFFF